MYREGGREDPVHSVDGKSTRDDAPPRQRGNSTRKWRGASMFHEGVYSTGITPRIDWLAGCGPEENHFDPDVLATSEVFHLNSCPHISASIQFT